MIFYIGQYIDHICTEISEVNLSAYVYRLFHKDFSSLVGPYQIYLSYQMHAISYLYECVLYHI